MADWSLGGHSGIVAPSPWWLGEQCLSLQGQEAKQLEWGEKPREQEQLEGGRAPREIHDLSNSHHLTDEKTETKRGESPCKVPKPAVKPNHHSIPSQPKRATCSLSKKGSKTAGVCVCVLKPEIRLPRRLASSSEERTEDRDVRAGHQHIHKCMCAHIYTHT